MHLDYQKLVVRNKRRGILRKIVSVLCCLVVFCTTYALILPAITMENHPFCGQEEHLHEEACYQKSPGLRLICGLQEDVPHRHEESCYVPGEPVEPTIHEHSDTCYLPGEPICGMEEDHIHEDSCYEVSLICGLEAGQPEPEEPAEPVLICTESVVPTHVHEDACFEETEPQPATDCGNWDPEHIHDISCYVTVCGLEAHSHTLVCFSDPEADVETPEIWEATLSNAVLTGDTAADVVSVAETQIGYMESTHNYDVWEDFSIHGYTRYGAWYGMPYGAWDGMFASFCLQYAGVDMPYHYDVQSWMAALDAVELYADRTETMAQKGNLIFLASDGSGTADRVGIVASVREAQEHTGADIKVIEGDSADTVRVAHYVPDDAVIVGYGLLPGQERIPVVPNEEETPACGQDDHEHDESCFVKHTEVVIKSQTELVTVTCFAVRVDAPEVKPVISTFRFRGTPSLLTDGEPEDEPEVPTTPTNIGDYVLENGGSIELVLLTSENNRLPMDENGKYVIERDTQYHLNLGFSLNEHGMSPGNYVYQFPEFFAYANQHGFLYDSADKNALLGEWTLDTNGLMSFEFYQVSNTYQSVALTTTIQTFVKENTQEKFEFDGKVYVVIIPDDELETEMTLTKFAAMDNEPGRIKWTVVMKPGSNDDVVGIEVYDTLETNQHYFSQSDKDAGITLGYSADGIWHQIIVTPTWIEDNGFTFEFPDARTCSSCNNHIFEYIPGAKYYLTYTTTSKIDNTHAEGYYQHENTVVIDELSASASISQQIGTPTAKIEKTGYLDPATMEFRWQIRTNIPAYTGGRSMYWQWADVAQIIDLDDWVPVDNKPSPVSAEDLAVTISANGRTLNVPYVSNVTRNDFYCYDFRPVSEYSDMAFFYIAAPCTCTAETCANWSVNSSGEGWCNSLYWQQTTDQTVTFCTCWKETTDSLVTIDIAQEGAELIERYGKQDLTFVNGVRLQGFYYENGQQKYNAPLDAQATIPIPYMIEKTLLDQANLENGYVARYKITVNDSKLDLSVLSDSGISIVDEMTEYLFYVPGTMVIRQVDKDNQERTLQYGTDYTMSTRQEVIEGENKNILTVNLLHPDACQYVLEYDAKVIAQTEIVNPYYGNAATVYLAGESYNVKTNDTYIEDYSYSASSYNVTLQKLCADSGAPLAGAVFGMFGQNGEKLTEAVTDNQGMLVITTDLKNNIIYKLHEPYYLQELQAPTGYILENTKYWFYICGEKDGTCTECANVPDHPGMVKAPADIITATNTMGGPVLPNTGGHGTTLYTMGGMLLTLAAAALLYCGKKRRKETRG